MLWSCVNLFNLDGAALGLFSNQYGRIYHMQSSPHSEKWYFKEVSKEEREKIEYEDFIEKFTRLFLLDDKGEFRNMDFKDYSPRI